MPEKYIRLERELGSICDNHDEDYNVGGGILDRWKADIVLFQKFKERLKWVDDWKIRIGIPIVAFIGIRIFGARTFNFTSG